MDDLLAEFGGSEILGTHPGHEVEAVPRRVYLSVGLRDEFECHRCKENTPPTRVAPIRSPQTSEAARSSIKPSPLCASSLKPVASKT